MRRLAAVAALAVLAFVGCGGGDDEEKAQPARPEHLLGVTIGTLENHPDLLDRELRVMARTGVSTLRLPFYWSDAQPVARMEDVPRNWRRIFDEVDGRPTSFAKTDVFVTAAARAGIALLPIVVSSPAWAARSPGEWASPPANTRDYAAFLRALIGRYGPDGTFWKEHPNIPKRPLRDWQLWNEPDHRHYWSDQPYVRDYVRLARAARGAIKDADPDARVVMAGFADRHWDAISAVYRAGAKGVFDVAAIHPYTSEPQNVLRGVRYAREALRRAGDGERPLWLTEVTWSSGQRAGHEPAFYETTPDGQAKRLAQVYPLLLRNRRALGIERIYWENWLSTDRDHSNPFTFSGLRRLAPDGSVHEKPAFEAFRRVALRVTPSGTR